MKHQPNGIAEVSEVLAHNHFKNLIMLRVIKCKMLKKRKFALLIDKMKLLNGPSYHKYFKKNDFSSLFNEIKQSNIFKFEGREFHTFGP